jgi:hypothetical protein
VQQTLNWGQESGTFDHFHASSNVSSSAYPSGAICFQLAHLICKILEPETDERRNELIRNAEKLCCYLKHSDSGSVRQTYQAIHCLLWAGLILRRPFVGIFVLHKRIDVLDNSWIFTAVEELRAVMIAKYPNSEGQIEKTFELVIKLLHKANEWSEMECVANKLNDPDIFKTNRMVLELRFIGA